MITQRGSAASLLNLIEEGIEGLYRNVHFVVGAPPLHQWFTDFSLGIHRPVFGCN
jgi:hypothetical protein